MDSRQLIPRDGPDMPIELRDFYLILHEMASAKVPTLNLERLRSSRTHFTDEQLWTRVSILLDQLGVPESRGLDVAKGFAAVIQNAPRTSAVSRPELESIVQRTHQEVFGDSNILVRYEHKVLGLLGRSDTGWVDDANHPESLSQPARAPWLDTKPIVRFWPKEILETAAWNRIESPIPGIPDLPIESTWVNLSLGEVTGRGNKTLEELERDAYSELAFDRRGGFSLEEVFLETQGLTVIMGLPGAGKSTLIKWIARYLVTQHDCPFGIPIVISLRHYAKEKAADRNLSLIDYFLISRGVSDSTQRVRWHSIMAGLLDPPDSSSNTADTFLWLFDGWDEVPSEMRDRILPEINSMSRYPGIMTTRYSADPLHLPARRFFELQGLKFGAALGLAHRWLEHTGRGEYYGGIETLLEENADLRRMSRNPFLLTLLCALYSDPHGRRVAALPRRRGEVLSRTLKLIYAQHNADAKQRAKFGRADKRHISTFAFWLMSEAPNSPRFVFDHQDYELCTSTVGSFESLLVPSRLIAVPSAGRDDYQFLHASFQEHLAAQHLADNPRKIPKGKELVLNQAWKEIVRFLAETVQPETEAWDTLWREVRSATSSFDIFGLMASRVALWVGAAGQRDGGKNLIGIDLRGLLWRVMERHAAQVPKPLIEAFLELDATDFARRILDHRIKAGRNSILVGWLELVSIFDLESLFTDHEKYRKVLSLPEVSAFCPELPDWVRRHDSVADSPESRVLKKFEQAVRSRDLESAKETFWVAVDSEFFEVASEALEMFDRFPPDAMEDTLFEIATSPKVDEITQGYAVRQLIKSGNKKAHHRLLLFLANLSLDDRLAFAILGNLDGASLNHLQLRVVDEFLRSSNDCETRIAAAELMSSSRSRGAAATLLSSFAAETHTKARVTILRELAEIADESTIENLWAFKDKGLLKNSAEWGLWLRAFLVTLRQRVSRVTAAGNFPGGDEVKEQIREWQHDVRELLRQRRGATRQQLLMAVFEFPHVFGPRAIDEMIQSIENPKASAETRIMAVGGLVQIGGEKTIQYLKEMITDKANNYPKEVLRAASDALGELSPAVLAGIKGKQAEETKARLAFRRDILFLNGKVLDVNPSSMKSSSKVTASSPIDWPISADIGVFLALQEEFDSFRDLLRRRGGVTWVPLDDPQKAFTYYRGEIKTPYTQQTVSVIAVCASEMGPERAANLASTYLTRCVTKTLVVVGIAGSLDSELRLGDVLVPNEVDAYLENSAAEDIGGSWVLTLSGRHFTADAHLLNQVRQLGGKAPVLLRGWESRAKRRLQRLLGAEDARRSLEKNLAKAKPEVFAADHHLATGPTVGKSFAFAEWLRSTNRKVSAMEMETAAVFDALETEIYRRRRLAIRGISDFADRRKTKVEKGFRGKFRQLSLLNASDYFLTLVEAGVFAEPISEND